jgi:hypothetical protein
MSDNVTFSGKWMVGVGLALGLLLSAPRDSSAQVITQRLSLNPYNTVLSNGAYLVSSGFDAPIRLPSNGSTPSFALGFTIPNDYIFNTAIVIEILWETPDSSCNFVLASNFLFRARDGHPGDGGGASGGLRPRFASTGFNINSSLITMAAPTTPHQTARVEFAIEPTPGEFDTLQAGDAINFGIFRLDMSASDTCSGELGIAGISILYESG